MPANARHAPTSTAAAHRTRAAALAALLLAAGACASCAGDRGQVASLPTANRYNAMGWLAAAAPSPYPSETLATLPYYGAGARPR